MLRTARVSDSAIGVSFVNARFRFDVFFVRLWLFIAWRRSSLPPAVTLNRFLALLDVFVFGIFPLRPRVLRGPQNHHHVAAVEEWLRLDLPDLLDVIREPQQQVAAALGMGRLAGPEHDRHLHLGALVQEALDVPLLGVVVVNPDLGPELDLLDVDLRLVLPRELRLLLLLVAVLPVIHHARHRRIGLRRDLDQVEALVEGVLHGLARGLNTELRAVLVDQPYLGSTDVIVDPCLRNGPRRRFDRSPRPQRAITKRTSILSLKRQNRCKQRPDSLVVATRLNPAELKLAR